MNNIGWLVNDCLTCIPGTKTFWHDLLENIPNLIDKTNVYTPFNILADVIETELKTQKPSYIIRNASYFRQINFSVKQISLLQDVNVDKQQQIQICNNSFITVFNSKFVKDIYPEINSNTEIIPLGIDFDLFQDKKSIKTIDVIYIGSSNVDVKGFDIILDLIKNSNFTFNLVMKDDFKIDNSRVNVFNKITHEKLVDIINNSKICICPSRVETLHLAGIECAACNVPILCVNNVGIYYELESGKWGLKQTQGIIDDIYTMINNLDNYSPRIEFLSLGLDKKTCINKWKNITDNIVGKNVTPP